MLYLNGVFYHSGGDMASTWVVKLKEHAGALVDLVKNEHILVADTNYQLAAA